MTENVKTPRVFIVQQPSQFDSDARGWRPKFDISPARQWGKLVLVLGPGNIFEDRLAAAVAHMEIVFASYTDRDYLLALGDPVAIAAAAMIASNTTGGVVKVLKWDRIARGYRCFPISLSKGAKREKSDSAA